jgi:hypothetical protein
MDRSKIEGLSTENYLDFFHRGLGSDGLSNHRPQSGHEGLAREDAQDLSRRGFLQFRLDAEGKVDFVEYDQPGHGITSRR